MAMLGMMLYCIVFLYCIYPSVVLCIVLCIWYCKLTKNKRPNGSANEDEGKPSGQEIRSAKIREF